MLAALTAATDAAGIVAVLERIRGPWALAFWQADAQQLWFGRDYFGRRSLLWRWCGTRSGGVQQLELVSVSPADGPAEHHGQGRGQRPEDTSELGSWEEVPATGVFCLDCALLGRAASASVSLRAAVLHVQWSDCTEPALSGSVPTALTLRSPVVDFNRSRPPPAATAATPGDVAGRGVAERVAQLLEQLEASVRRRVCWQRRLDTTAGDAGSTDGQQPRVGILFSGGIDSMMIAAVVDRVLPPGVPIDLFNVAFENPRFACNGRDPYGVPDRVTGEAGVAELRALGTRIWRWLPVNVSLFELSTHRAHIRSLVSPLTSVMDESIACAIWFAAGHTCDTGAEAAATNTDLDPGAVGKAGSMVVPDVVVRLDAVEAATAAFAAALPSLKARATVASRRVASMAAKLGLTTAARTHDANAAGGAAMPKLPKPRVLLVGMGADEQLAGYGRHRTRYNNAGWDGLIAEVEMDIRRISYRNLGRDDRCISDHGVEARFPFLDEDLVNFLSRLPMHHKVNFELERGLGEKWLLRECARSIGLGQSADLPKRAIQFGSRIAKIDGAKIKGSDTF